MKRKTGLLLGMAIAALGIVACIWALIAVN